MRSKKFFRFIGITPAFGKIYEKGNIQIVVYSNGDKRMFIGFPHGSRYERGHEGMRHYKTVVR